MPLSCKVSIAVRLPKRNGNFSALFDKYDEHEATCNHLTHIYQNNGRIPIVGSMATWEAEIIKETKIENIYKYDIPSDSKK